MEIWKEIKGFDYPYEVSSFGRIKSPNMIDAAGRRRKEKIFNGSLDGQGYVRTCLRQNGSFKTVRIHALVAEAFLGYERNGLMDKVVTTGY